MSAFFKTNLNNVHNYRYFILNSRVHLGLIIKVASIKNVKSIKKCSKTKYETHS